MDRDSRTGSPRQNTGEHGDRYHGGGQWAQGGRDQWAERDRDMYGDHDYDRNRDWAASTQRGGASDSERGSGYGHDDGNRGGGNQDREQMNYRGQSGSQAGNHYSTHNMNYPNQQGGNRGHWGDFDRGGQSGGRDRNYDTQSPRFGSESDRNYGQSGQSGQSGWNTQQGFSGQQGTRGPHSGKGPQGFQRPDERVKEMIHEALTDHEHIDATHITVDVKSGEVVLTGTVDDRNAKRLAEDIVERVSGVKDVQNQLRVSTSTNTSHMTPSTNTTNNTTSNNDKKTAKPS
ncbi:MAG: BON domain-containing protein [Deltaproteobacteria bacterium]